VAADDVGEVWHGLGPVVDVGRGVSDLFLAKLDDQELAVLESGLFKVTLACTFG
jgi:hypothetical protein